MNFDLNTREGCIFISFLDFHINNCNAEQPTWEILYLLLDINQI